MHRYTVTDIEKNGESVTVYWRLGLYSSFIATAGNYVLHQLSVIEPKLSLVSIPVSTAAIYLALAKIVGTHLWRYRLSRAILGISTPIVHGKWNAVVTSRNGETVLPEVKGTFAIAQRWRTISISLITDSAKSHSTSSAIVVENDEVRLEHQYYAENRHNPKANPKFVDHRGAAFVTFPSSEIKPRQRRSEPLTLSYFTSHGEYGIISLAPVTSDRL